MAKRQYFCNAISAIHNKDYSVVKTFRLPSSFNGGIFAYLCHVIEDESPNKTDK